MKRISVVLLHVIFFLFLLPLLILAVASFTEDGLSQDQGVFSRLTFQQYRVFFQNQELLLRFRNSALLAGGSLLAGLPVAILGGFWLNKSHCRFVAFFRLGMMVSLLLPVQSVMVPVFRFARWTGLYGRPLAVILMQTFLPLGPLTIFFLLRTIPEEQWEAGLLDCKSYLRIFIRAILPQMIPGVMILCLFLFAEAWNLVEWPLILLPEDMWPASLALNDINGQESHAASVCYCLPILAASGLMAVGSRKKRNKGNPLRKKRVFLDKRRKKRDNTEQRLGA